MAAPGAFDFLANENSNIDCRHHGRLEMKDRCHNNTLA